MERHWGCHRGRREGHHEGPFDSQQHQGLQRPLVTFHEAERTRYLVHVGTRVPGSTAMSFASTAAPPMDVVRYRTWVEAVARRVLRMVVAVPWPGLAVVRGHSTRQTEPPSPLSAAADCPSSSSSVVVVPLMEAPIQQ